MFKGLIFIAFLCLTFMKTFHAQVNYQGSIQFRDVHTSEVTNILVHPNGNYFFTSDATGKILLWNTKEYKVIRTIAEGDGQPVIGMRLIENDSTLFVSSGYQGKLTGIGERFSYSYNTYGDSMIYFHPFDNRPVIKKPLSFDILGNEYDPIIMIGFQSEEQNVLLGLSKEQNHDIVFSIESKHVISKAQFDPMKKMIAFTEYQGLNEKNLPVYHLNILDSESKNKLYSKDFENETVVNFVFDPEKQFLHLFVFNRDKQKMRIERISLENFKDNVTGEFSMIDAPSNALIQSYEGQTISFTGFFSGELILKNVNGTFEKMNTGLSERIEPQLINSIAFIPDKKHLIFFNSINTYFGRNPEFKVWDHTVKKEVTQFNELPRTTTKAYFLPDDNWMVEGTETNREQFSMLSPLKPFIKYYTNGTFSNRFGRLNMVDYISNKFDVHFASNAVDYALDENSGKMVFVGIIDQYNSKYYGRWAYLVYDLINDQLDTTCTVEPKYPIIIDYCASKNRILTTYNDDSRPFKVIDGDKEIHFEGEYIKGKLSQNGEYVLLINDKGLVTIYSVDNQKLIYQQNHAGSYFKYSLGAIDQEQFWLSYSSYNTEAGMYQDRTVILQLVGTTFKELNYENMNVSCIAAKNNKVAIIAQNVGVILDNNRILKFDYGNFPYQASLNASGNRLMLAMNDGTVQLYDTDSLRQIGTMNHPDSRSHIIVNKEGFFAANTAIDPYLTISKQAGQEMNRPEKVLELFGTPNPVYHKMLQQSTSIYNNRMKDNKSDALTFSKTDEQGDLYLMAVGISDYQQNEFNLTFADKDALDLSLLYGDSSSIDVGNYEEKFFGDRYFINYSGEKRFAEIRNYAGAYSSFPTLFQVDNSGKRWLEVQNKTEFYLWDFEKVKKEKVILKNTSYGLWIEETFIRDPEDLGFCYRNDDGNWLFYSFEDRSSISIIKPENALFIGQQRWITMSESGNYSEIDVTIRFHDGEKNKITDSLIVHTTGLNNFTLEAVSPDEKQFLLRNDKQAFLVVKENDKVSYRLLKWGNHVYGSSYYFSKDGKKISSLRSVWADDNTSDKGFWNYTYEIETNILDSSFFDDSDFSKVGINNLNGELKWIGKKDPIAEIPNTFLNTFDDKVTIKPYSFDKVHTLTLTNEAATKENILASMDKFYSTASHNDQLILFFAGHGMLDSTLQFYFAPHDIDFKKPEITGISYDTILSKLNQSGSGRKLLLLDACHSGDVFSPTSSNILAKSDTLNDVRGGKTTNTSKTQVDDLGEIYDLLFGSASYNNGITVIAASSGVDKALESKKISNGAFTSAFIETIYSSLKGNSFGDLDPKQNKEILLSEENLYEIRKKVIFETDGRQVPNVRALDKLNKIQLW